MADGPITQLSDVIVPEIFTPQAQLQTEEKSRIIQSGAMVSDPTLSAAMAGAGLTFNMPKAKDLDNDEENISTDEADDSYTGGSANSTPQKTGSIKEVGVRLSRNQSWSSADLVASLSMADPMQSIASRVGAYWARRLQAATIATMQGVFADNDAAPTGSEHVQGDLTNDIKGASYAAGTTDFSGDAVLDTLLTMGDSMDDIGLVFCDSTVYNRMQKQNLIEFVEHSEAKIRIPMYMNRQVIVDDGMPSSNGVHETWFFGAGALRFGQSTPKTPTETDRKPDSGNGGGSDVLYNRVEWCVHPVGMRYAGTAPDGGPSNAATTNNLAHAASWVRAFNERKMIKVCRLVTREAPAV